MYFHARKHLCHAQIYIFVPGNSLSALLMLTAAAKLSTELYATNGIYYYKLL